MGGRCKRVVASGSGVSPSTPSHLKKLRWFAGEATKGRAEQLGGIMKVVVDYINMPSCRYAVVISNGKLSKVRVK